MRRLRNKMRTVGFAIFALLIILGGCSNNTQPQNKVLRLAIERSMTTLNYQTTTSRAEIEQISQLLEGLTRYNNQKELVGAGAESWEISSDYLTYTFKLRKNARWSNDTPVTAHDYVFAWQNLLVDPVSSNALFTKILKNGKAVQKKEVPVSELGVKALDDYTLQVMLEHPYTPFLDSVSTVTYYPVNEAFYQEVTKEKFGTDIPFLLTNGPFTLKTYNPTNLLEFTKSSSYWDAQNVALQEVIVNIVPELSTQSAMFDSGELDILRITNELTDKYTDDAQTISELESRIVYLYLSGTTSTPNELLSNQKFRQAIAYAIDKNVISENILKDGSKPLEGIIPAQFGVINDQSFREFSGTHNTPIYNKAKANELFNQAKQELGAMSDYKLTIAVQGIPVMTKVFENVKAQIEMTLPEVSVELQTIPNQVYTKEAMKKATPAGVGSWSAAFVDYFNFMELFQANTTFNYANYNNDEYEQFLSEAIIEGDALKQATLYQKAEDILIRDAVYIPLYQVGAKYRLSPKVQGFILNRSAPTIDYKLIDIK